MTDVTDHLAKTRAQLEACARRGQWDHVMAIGGYKSRDAAKSGMGYSLIDIEPVIKTEPMPFQTYPEPNPIISGSCKKTPAPRGWVVEVRQRIAALKMDLSEFSVLLGKSKTYMSTLLGSERHCPPGARIQVEAQIIRLEKIERAA